MSSDEGESSRKRKRKVRRLLDDSSASTSSENSSIIWAPSSSMSRRRNVTVINDSTESEISDASDVIVKKKKVPRVKSSTDYSSDEDSSPIINRRSKQLQVLMSDSEDDSDSDDSDIIVQRRIRNLAPLVISDSDDAQWESVYSDSDEPPQKIAQSSTSVSTEEKAIDSDSSDGQSDKCPICLISFRLQEVGIPENCEHTFCLECIQEWSKNMNTCPVDRKEYHSITVKTCINGKFLRRIAIERPEVPEEPVDIIELTFCEICGSNENEDRLLLCDGCDLGFHLYCLTPPLDDVPDGTWYCNDCGPGVNQNIDFDEVVALYDDAEELLLDPLVIGRNRQRRTTRLIPRTRQSERVRRQVENNRDRRRRENLYNTPSTSDGRVNSNRVSSTTAASTKKPKKKSRKSTRKQSGTAKYKTVWVLNEFGEAVATKKKISSRKSKSRKKRARRTSNKISNAKLLEKNVKKRLAAQLGICAPRNSNQILPDVRISNTNTENLLNRRHRAGIPSLHLFGNFNQLDYFSESDNEEIINEGEHRGVHTLLSGRIRNPTGSLRRAMRRKAAVVNLPTVSSSTDILDSIMDAQTKMLSKNTTFSIVDSSGKLKIENKNKEPILNNNSPSKPDFNSYKVKETPWYGRNNSGYRGNRNSWSNNRNWQNNSRDYQGNNYGNSNNHGQSGSNFGGNYQQRRDDFYNDIPQDYTQRTLCEAEMMQEETERDKNDNDSDVDFIYGDIENETVSTSQIEDDYNRPPSPRMTQGQASYTNTDEDNDSESGMVIDTDKVPDDSVSSTVGIPLGQAYSPGQPTHSPEQQNDEASLGNKEKPYCPTTDFTHPPPLLTQPPPVVKCPPPLFSRPPPDFSLPPPDYSSMKPTYSTSSATYSQPTYSPGKPAYSPGDPTTGSPDPCQSTDGSGERPVRGALGYDELQKELASGYDALQREIASGYDQLQREFASGLKEFQPLLNQTETGGKSVANEPVMEDIPLPQDNDIPLPKHTDIPLPNDDDIPLPRDPLPDNKNKNIHSSQNNLSYDCDSPLDDNNSLPQDDEILSTQDDISLPQDEDVPSPRDDDTLSPSDVNLSKGDESSMSKDKSFKPARAVDAPKVLNATDNVPESELSSENILELDATTGNISELEATVDKVDVEASVEKPEVTEKTVPTTSKLKLDTDEQEEEKDERLCYSNPFAPSAGDLFNPPGPPVKPTNEDDDLENDGCPNFSIYSRQSKSVALTTDISLSSSQKKKQKLPISEGIDAISDESESLPSTPQVVTVEKTGADPRLKKHLAGSWNLGALYSDSEDESVVKKTSTFGISDIKDMTEDILSEEDRSYTPVLDEKVEKPKEGFEGLGTELISDDDRNDFDESHELKMVSDGDALEINAKESELDFTRPEDFEEGEIIDKNKDTPVVDVPGETPDKKAKKDKGKPDKKVDKDGKRKKKEKSKGKETVDVIAEKENIVKEIFKKLTKNSKERSYRDKDKTKSKEVNRERSRSKTPEMTEKERQEAKKKKRKELERYSVRAIIAEKPRVPPKDQFGRDLRRSSSRGRSRSYTPPIVATSPARVRRTPSPIRAPSPVARRKSRSVSRTRTPPREKDKASKRKGRSLSRSRGRKRDRSKTKKRKRSASRNYRRKKSKDKGKRRRSHSRRHSRSPSLRRHRNWTPSLSKSPSPPIRHTGSPSWTPPRDDAAVLRNQNLTVILNNDAAKKKKEKRPRDRRRKEDTSSKRRRRERDRTPPPSKEVFASGDNILVSVSFNNENETRDISTRDNRIRKDSAEQQKKTREKRNKNKKDISGIKPVAIIDLDRSPFQEIPASPKDVIVLSDSDNNETDNRNVPNNVCDLSQQVASPEETPDYATGPKTPPEPSVKFSLMPKAPQVRAINNPLHDPLETIEEEVPEEMNNSSYIGPNTPPEEPPTSPPSSPDAYDPFEPTKSRSPSPANGEVQGDMMEEQNQEADKRSSFDMEKTGQTPDVSKSLTPPMPDIQPADSQSSVQEITDPTSPDERIGGAGTQQQSSTKPVGQTIPFSSVQTSIISSTPAANSITISRINILSTAMITPATTIPQRIVLPNQVKSSPVKIPPTKGVIKSAPIKPMQSKTSTNKSNSKQNGNNLGLDDINLDFDSPYSPGSSDYEDLFEPPSEPPTAAVKPKVVSKPKRSAHKKGGNTFDNLFGSPAYNNKKTSKKSSGKKPSSKIKHVGVKVDEDSLKILEELPNSAVEMQVKDKFLKKLNRQERVVEEVKLVLKPYYNKKKLTKEEYKDIMRRAVPKICHNKTGEINPIKIRQLIEAYVKKAKHSKKVTSSSSMPQKVVV